MSVESPVVRTNRLPPALADVRFLGALGLVLVNDLYLKTQHPGIISGKLSDVAGFVVFPVVVAALLAVLDRHPRPVTIVGGIAVWFVGLQLSSTVDSTHEMLMSAMLPWAPVNTADPTDLLALPAAFFGLRVLNAPEPMRVGSRTRSAILGVGLMACLADQPPPSPENGAAVERDDGTVEIAVADDDLVYSGLRSVDGGATWTAFDLDTAGVSDALDPERWPSTQMACLASVPDVCVSVEDTADGVRVVESIPGEAEELKVAWEHIDERYVRQTFGSTYGAGGVTVLADDTVIVTTRGGPILRRAVDGTWSPEPLALRRSNALAYAIVVAVITGVTLAALVIRTRTLPRLALAAFALVTVVLVPAPLHVDLGIAGLAWFPMLAFAALTWLVLLVVTLIRGLRRSDVDEDGTESPRARLWLLATPILTVIPIAWWLARVDVRVSAVWFVHWAVLIAGAGLILALVPSERKATPPPPRIPSPPSG